MANDQLRLQYLLTQYAANNCTREELLELFTMIGDAEEDTQLHDSLEEVWHTISATDKLPNIDKDSIFTNILNEPPVRRLQPLGKWISYAAAVLILFAVPFALHKFLRTKQVSTNNTVANNIIIKPGSNKAVLTLANGTQIPLNNTRSGIIATQNNIPVTQQANGAIAYQAHPAGTASIQSFNTLATPVGGQFTITLADGTKVWLNALSSIKYPVSFSGTERRVELTGEAYFEVAKNKTMPFIVSVNNSEIKVYGTHFNIMGYNAEDNTNVTLLEGSVKVSNADGSKMLLPGQQAVIKNGIAISPADGEQAIAWKNGKFNFAHEQIQSIMRKLARWYDIDVTYQGKPTREGFVGTLPRTQNLAEILKTLELTGLVHFKTVGRSVTVMP